MEPIDLGLRYRDIGRSYNPLRDPPSVSSLPSHILSHSYRPAPVLALFAEYLSSTAQLVPDKEAPCSSVGTLSHASGKAKSTRFQLLKKAIILLHSALPSRRLIHMLCMPIVANFLDRAQCCGISL